MLHVDIFQSLQIKQIKLLLKILKVKKKSYLDFVWAQIQKFDVGQVF